MASDRYTPKIESLLDPDPLAQQHLEKSRQEHNEQYLALRRRAQGLFEALKGRTGIRTPADLDKLLEKTRKDYDTGVFLVERLGTSRFLDPELTSVLIRLRNELLAEIANPTAADMMNVDAAIMGYRNILRVQNLLNNCFVEVERHLFGQLSLNDVLGQTEAAEVSRLLAEVEQKLIPLLEKCHKMMIRALDRLPTSGRTPKDAMVQIGVAGQVNVR